MKVLLVELELRGVEEVVGVEVEQALILLAQFDHLLLEVEVVVEEVLTFFYYYFLIVVILYYC